MQIIVILIFAALWSLTFWVGSVALEATGMERARARFQVLSAITGTGFTTTEAEAVVNHPTRRRIATWLIFIGNTGAVAFIVGLILFVRAGIKAPSTLQIVIIVLAVLVPVLLIKLGVIDGLTNGFLHLIRRGRAASAPLAEEVVCQTGGYCIARLKIGDNAAGGLTIANSGISQRGATILALERGGVVFSLPAADEKLLPGDCLLCYGETGKML